MKRKFFGFCSLIITAVSLFLLTAWGFYSCRTDTLSKKIDGIIIIDKLSDRALVVKLGVDALTAVAIQKGIVVIDAGISNSLSAKYRNVIVNEFNRNDFI